MKGSVLVILKLFTILHVSCPPAAISPVAENEPIPVWVQSPENDGYGPVISVWISSKPATSSSTES